MSTLTGRTRFRHYKPLLRAARLVLQVEYTETYTQDLNGSGYYDTWTRAYWRDATLEDFPNGALQAQP